MWKIGEEYKADNPSKDLKSPEATINECMETITTNKNNTNSTEPIHKLTDKEDLMNLTEEYSNFLPPTLDGLGADATIVVSESFIQGMSATYYITVQERPTIALLDTGPNMSFILPKNLNPCLNSTLLKSHIHRVMSASGAN